MSTKNRTDFPQPVYIEFGFILIINKYCWILEKRNSFCKSTECGADLFAVVRTSIAYLSTWACVHVCVCVCVCKHSHYEINKDNYLLDNNFINIYYNNIIVPGHTIILNLLLIFSYIYNEFGVVTMWHFNQIMVSNFKDIIRIICIIL